MKYFKIFMLMMATVAFAACSSDDDGWNGSGDAVVSMANQEITWKENKGSSTPVYVPITVTGERNGNVQVTVQVKETGENPAMDDIHYIITSKTVVIPADATQGKIELRTVDGNTVDTDPSGGYGRGGCPGICHFPHFRGRSGPKGRGRGLLPDRDRGNADPGAGGFRKAAGAFAECRRGNGSLHS